MRESTRTALASGQSIPCKAGDRHTVVLSHELTYRVETRHGSGSQTVDTLTCSFATDRCASVVGRAIVTALRAGKTVEETRDAVLDELTSAYADEVKAWYRDPAYVADLDRAINIFTPPSDRERLEQMADEMRVSLAGVL